MFFYYLFLLLLPFQEHPKLGAVLFDLGFVPITPTKLVGFCMALAGAFAPRIAQKNHATLLPRLYSLFAIVPILGNLFRGFAVPSATVSTLLSYGMLLYATRRLVSTRQRLLSVIRVLFLADAIGSLWLYKQQYILHMANPNGPSSDPNYEALALAMAIPLAVYLILRDQNVIWRTVAIVFAPILGFAIFVSQSRGGVVALTVLAMTAWFHSRHKFATALIAIVVLGLAATIAPSTIWQRFHEIRVSGRAETGAEVSTRTRIELWRAGIRMIETHPLVGIGTGRFKEEAPFYNPDLLGISHRAYIAHNTYVQVCAETGIPILIVFVVMLNLARRNCRRVEQFEIASLELRETAFALRLGLTAYFVAAFFLSAQLVKSLWMFIWLSDAICRIADSDSRPQRADASMFSDHVPEETLVA